MTILFSILFLVLAMIAVLLIAGLLVNKGYSIERVVYINKSKPEVFDFIKELKNQDQYNKWLSIDPDVKKTYTGIDGTVGFMVAWDSANKQVGKGEQEIKKIKPGERIDFEIRFVKPVEGTAHTFMETASIAEGTKVRWGFNGVNNYPMNVIFKLFNLENKLADDISESLNRLKKTLE